MLGSSVSETFKVINENGEIIQSTDFTKPRPVPNILNSESSNKYIGMKIQLPHNGRIKEGRVVRRKRNSDGTLMGTYNDNPLLYTRIYDEDFGDSDYINYSANVILENLYNHIDDNGHSGSLFKSIIDHKKSDDAP